jgi:hypothetical protein
MKNTMLTNMASLRQLTIRSLFGLPALAALMLGQSATATAQVSITQVFVDDPVADQVTIIGSDFDNGPNLVVTLGEFATPLNIVGSAPTQIVVDLPVGLTAGDYRLSVRTGAVRTGRTPTT